MSERLSGSQSSGFRAALQRAGARLESAVGGGVVAGMATQYCLHRVAIWVPTANAWITSAWLQTVPAAREFEAALAEYERNHWPQAYEALTRLADRATPRRPASHC